MTEQRQQPTASHYTITNESTNAIVGIASDIPNLYYVLCSMAMPDSILQDELRITYGGMCIACHETADTLCEHFRQEAVEAQQQQPEEETIEDITAEYEQELDAQLADFYEDDFR
jgi:hypothetical protein